MSLLAFLQNRWTLLVFCALFTFGEMFIVKKSYTHFTKNIQNNKLRRGLNVIFGLVACFVLATVQMWVFCEALGAVFYWKFVIASALGATLLYLVLEKILGESEVNALGKAFCELVSHSDLFDGDLTTDGVISIGKKFITIVDKLNEKEAAKEKEAVDKVTELLEGFLSDGKVTKEEEIKANEAIKESGLDLNGNSTYEKFKALKK